MRKRLRSSLPVICRLAVAQLVIGHSELKVGCIYFGTHGGAGIHRQVAAVHRNDRAGDPRRRIGGQQHHESLNVSRLAESSRRDAAQPLVLERRVGGHALFEARVDDLRGEDRVDAHAAAAPLGAQFARHLHDRSHRHAVGNVAAAQRRLTGERADVEDAAAARLQHSSARFLTHREAAEDQVLKDLLHRVERDLFRLAEDSFAGDVAEKVDPAKLAIEPRKHLPDRDGIRNVASDRDRSPA